MPGLQDRRSLTKQTQLPLRGYVDCSSTVERLIVAQETRVRLPPAQLRAAFNEVSPSTWGLIHYEVGGPSPPART